LCRTAFWDSKLSEVHTSHHRSILDKMGGASTHPGMWSVLAYFELEQYLVLVYLMTFHKYTSTQVQSSTHIEKRP